MPALQKTKTSAIKGLLKNLIFVPIICFAASITTINTQAIILSKQIKKETTYSENNMTQLESMTSEKNELTTKLNLLIDQTVTEATIKNQTDINNITEVKDELQIHSNKLQEQQIETTNELNGLKKRLSLIENTADNEQINELNTSIEEKQEKLNKIDTDLNDILKKIDHYQTKINTLQVTVNTAKKQATEKLMESEADLVKNINKLENDCNKIEHDIESHEQTIKNANDKLTVSKHSMPQQICLIEIIANTLGIALNILLEKKLS